MVKKQPLSSCGVATDEGGYTTDVMNVTNYKNNDVPVTLGGRWRFIPME